MIFFLLIKILLMLSYFLYNSIIVTWCIQRGVNLVHMVDQTNKFNVMFDLPCSFFILINKLKRFFKHSRSQNFLIFLLIELLLMPSYFLKHLLNQAQLLMIQSDLCVCTCYCWQSFLGNEFGQSQSWYEQVMSLKPD